jgi:hypothetical protein
MGNIIFIAFYPSLTFEIKFTKIMLPMLTHYTNYGFHELFLNSLIDEEELKEREKNFSNSVYKNVLDKYYVC